MGETATTAFGRPRRSEGQISIPFLFVLPSLVLFIFLLYETAKLSREKIRHQFAADAAASVEMSQHSDFLNRSAYINGAFPQRLLREGFWNLCIQHKRSDGVLPNQCTSGFKGDRLYEILANNGAFPRWLEKDEEGIDEAVELDDDPLWLLKYNGCGEAKNSRTPDLDTCKEPGDKYGTLHLITVQDANDYWLTWDDAKDVYNLYVQVYQLLGSAEDSLYEVFKNNVKDAYYYKRSYQLNTGATPLEGARGGANFARVGSGFEIRPYCIQDIMIHGTKPALSIYLPYQVFKPDKAVQMEETIKDCWPGPGLLQAVTVAPDTLRDLRANDGHAWPGIHSVQPLDLDHTLLSDNFFGVDFHDSSGLDFSAGPLCPWGSGPCVSATAAVTNPAQGDGSDMNRRNGVWPYPTPKFQVRLYP